MSDRTLPVSQLLKLSVYWFGILTIWGSLNKIVLPARVDDIDPAHAGTLLFVMNAVAVIAAILVQPTIGVISDNTTSRWGRRKPYIVIGALLDVVFLLGIASSQSYLSLLAFLVLLQCSSNFAQGPFQGYVPDLVPARQVGLASGLMGAMIVLGQIAGVGIGSLGLALDNLFLTTIAVGVIEVLTMVVLVTSVNEGSAGPRRTRPWPRIALSAWGLDILGERNVLWLLGVRLLFLGAVASTSFGLFYFERSHGLPQAEAGGVLFLGTLIVGVMTAAAAIPGGRLSDRVGRKPIIYVSCGLAALGMAAVAVAPSPVLAIAAFVPFGLGTGAFLSVDWALMTDVIPKETAGRYMGILNAGTAAAEPLFLAVAGVALDVVGRTVSFGAGPRAAMLVAVVFLAGSALLLTRVDPRRREAPSLAATAAG
ncbi:MAG: MFS transporter [Candidatus Limnocylindria bacterium]